MASTCLSVNIKYVNEVKETLTIDPDQIKLVSHLKAKIQDLLSIPSDQQRLIFAGKLMKDAESLSTYSLFNGCTLHLVRMTPKPNTATEQQSAPQTAPQPAQHTFTNPLPQQPSMQPQMLQQQMLQNPEVLNSALQMMQSNPQLFQAIMRSNPAFANMPPETQAMFSNPEFMRLMLNPEVVGAMMQANPAAMEAGMPQVPAFGQQQQPQVPPAERFAAELQQLKQMGFYDESLNLQALTLSGGNVNAAVEWLLSRPF